MFTGIIEEKGTLHRLDSGGEWGKLTIGARKVLSGTRIGDSIAVNGVCLTVTSMGTDSFTADVMAETMRRTNLGSLKQGEPVNLERAMAADGRFGGHIVSGHIDGTGVVKEQRREGNAVWVTIEAPPKIMALIMEKGSVTIDGVSLTAASVKGGSFQVSVIPHTGAETTLLSGKTGRKVNLENDIVGKYVQKLMEGCLSSGDEDRRQDGRKAGGQGGLTEDFLRKHGF